jgi:hypothetical protein
MKVFFYDLDVDKFHDVTGYSLISLRDKIAAHFFMNKAMTQNG